MNFYDISWQLADLIEGNKAVYFKTEPEVPDFTVGMPFKVQIFVGKLKMEFTVDQKNIVQIVALFDVTIFDKDKIDRLYVWNLKSFLSYFYSVSKKYCTPTTSVIDLSLIENFLNIHKNPPENFIESLNRVKEIVKYKGWQSLYKSIHLPLALRVLPSIENASLLNEDIKKTVNPYYEIEGQSNGRMNCLKVYARSYLPHNMGPDVKKVLKPRGYGTRFLCSDFRHCEITVLQWLCGDPRLKEILDSGLDLHKSIYEIITGDKCDTENKRKLSKKIFLPVMYGCGASSLANSLGMNVNIGAQLIDRIKYNFPVAWDWLLKKQEEAKNGIILDYFNRPRLFEASKCYLARNFVVQGVAATVCQEKLIELHKQLDTNKAYLVFSVHDGFGLVCKIESAHETYKLVKQICEAESQFCAGLRMKVEIKFGAKLDQMKVLWKD